MSETLVYLLFFLPTGKLLEWLLMFNPSYTYQVTCITLQSHNCTSIAYQVKPLIGQMFFLFFLVQLVKSRAEIKFTERERKIGTCWKLKNGQKIFEQNQNHHKKRPQYREQKLRKFGLKNWSLFSESFIVIFLVKTMLQYWNSPEGKQNEIIKRFCCLAEWEKGPLQLVFQVHIVISVSYNYTCSFNN